MHVRVRKRSAAITLVLAGSAGLGGSGATPGLRRRSVFATFTIRKPAGATSPSSRSSIPPSGNLASAMPGAVTTTWRSGIASYPRDRSPATSL